MLELAETVKEVWYISVPPFSLYNEQKRFEIERWLSKQPELPSEEKNEMKLRIEKA